MSKIEVLGAKKKRRSDPSSEHRVEREMMSEKPNEIAAYSDGDILDRTSPLHLALFHYNYFGGVVDWKM